MPIRPEERARYPKDWKAISLSIRGDRARWTCEGSPGHYPDCRAKHGEAHPVTGSKVVLTTAHLDHDPGHNHPDNLMAMCQRCHLAYDAKHHAHNAAITRAYSKGQPDLFIKRKSNGR